MKAIEKEIAETESIMLAAEAGGDYRTAADCWSHLLRLRDLQQQQSTRLAAPSQQPRRLIG